MTRASAVAGAGRARAAAPYLVAAVALVLVRATDAVPVLALVFIGTQMVGGVAALRAGRLAADRAAARPWRLLAAAFVLLAIAGVAYVRAGIVQDSMGSGVRHSGWLWLAFMLRAGFMALAVGVLLMLSGDAAAGGGRRRMVLDGATLVGGGFMAAWYFVIGPVVDGAQTIEPEVASQFATLTVSDLVLFMGIVTLLLRGAELVGRRTLLLLLATAAAFLVGDISQLLPSLNPDLLVPERWRLELHLLPVLLATLATVEQCRSSLRGRVGGSPDESGWGRSLPSASWLPYVALVGGFGLLAVAAGRSSLYPWTGLVAGGVIMTFSVAARQFSVLSENRSMATTDALTGLANRIELQGVLEAAAIRSRSGVTTAVMVIDLDDFKPVNDTLGHDAGDALLVRFAQVLRATVRRSDTAARLGGDEFAVVLNDVPSPEVAVEVAERILAGLETPFDILGRPVRIKASIGVSVSPPGRVSRGDELMREADLAMYEAKREKGCGWQLFVPGSSDVRAEQARLRDELRSAVGANQLQVAYQPVVALATGDVVGVEALVRWRHPTRGLLTPDAFLPLAERHGLIHDIDLWVLREACREVRGWQQEMPPGRGLRVNANLSAGQLSRPRLASLVFAVLDETGFDPADLVLEINETSELAVSNAQAHCRALRERGVQIALDDFGSGHSPLEHLLRMPVDVIKLDRCFVTDLALESASMAIAQAVIRLAHLLEIDTVAEGIETPTQADEMLRLGYGSGQGYHFGRPLSPDGIREMLGLPLIPAETESLGR